MLISSDPRAKVIIDPSGVNKLLGPASSKPVPVALRRGGAGRGNPAGGRRDKDGSKARRGAIRSLSDRMDLD